MSFANGKLRFYRFPKLEDKRRSKRSSRRTNFIEQCEDAVYTELEEYASEETGSQRTRNDRTYEAKLEFEHRSNNQINRRRDLVLIKSKIDDSITNARALFESLRTNIEILHFPTIR